jgi:hypothetical protein
MEHGLRRYLWILMGGLLFQGVGSLIFRLAPVLPAQSPLLVRGAFGIDLRHALIHIVWGLVGIAIVASSRSPTPLINLALIFGLFYTGLAIWGVSTYHPLGLELDLPENLFHFVAGPSTLAFGLWCSWQRFRPRGRRAL